MTAPQFGVMIDLGVAVRIRAFQLQQRIARYQQHAAAAHELAGPRDRDAFTGPLPSDPEAGVKKVYQLRPNRSPEGREDKQEAPTFRRLKPIVGDMCNRLIGVANDNQKSSLGKQSGSGSTRPRFSLAMPTRSVLVASAAVICLPCAAASVAPALAYANLSTVKNAFSGLTARTTAIVFRDSTGVMLGETAQPTGNVGHISAHIDGSVPADFTKAVNWLEARHSYYGLAPASIAKSGLCFATHSVFIWLGAPSRHCGGASTLEMQTSRTLRFDTPVPARTRKLREILDALSLSVAYPEGTKRRANFIADNLRFGTSAGREIYGLQNAAMVTFGVSPEKLSLAQSLVLAAAPKRQLELRCETLSAPAMAEAKARADAIKRRAAYALAHAFAGDPRSADAAREIHAMALLTPAPLDPSFLLGLPSDESCRAAGDPVARAQILASGETLEAERELRSLDHPGLAPVTDVRLSVSLPEQQTLKAAVESQLTAIEHTQGAHWTRTLSNGSKRAQILLVSTRPDGSIRDFYASTAEDLLRTSRREGSVSKIAVALAAAHTGHRAVETLCDKRDVSAHDAGNREGYANCTGPALVSVAEAFGRSENLPLLKLARDAGADEDRAAALAAGFIIPVGVEPAYALAIGMAESQPRRTLATISAISRGVARQPAMAPLPRIVSAFKSGAQWQTPPALNAADLRAWFSDPTGVEFLRTATSAAIRYPAGTLRGALNGVQPQEGEVAKSGTDARSNLDTWGKFSTGGLNGSAWFTMVVAPSGPIGDRTVSTIGLSQLMRGRTVAAFSTQPVSAP